MCLYSGYTWYLDTLERVYPLGEGCIYMECMVLEIPRYLETGYIHGNEVSWLSRDCLEKQLAVSNWHIHSSG